MAVLRIGIAGSAANPPHLEHRRLIKMLIDLNLFDMLFWIPSGVRSDKPGFVSPHHRVAMTELTIPQSWLYKTKTEFRILYDEVYGDNTPTISLLKAFQEQYPVADISWITGSDSVCNLPNRQTFLIKDWIGGNELMERWNFVIIHRAGYPIDEATLPKNCVVLPQRLHSIASSDIRQKIAAGLPFEQYVTASVAAYIKRYELYGYKKG